MKKKISLTNIEGAVSVEGDVTPITRNPISKITPERWGEMSASELHAQREILVNRYYGALQAGLLEGAKTIQNGIMAIDEKLEEIGIEGPGFL
ncbi:MAG: hypothetical protein KGI25_09570 [Thaumarchaeota archaeon]|nr:hypothetical protein [Nitrososphaerota archaeon]